MTSASAHRKRTSDAEWLTCLLLVAACQCEPQQPLSGWPRKFFGGQGAGSWPRPGLEELSRTVLAFIDRYNHTARPFNWKFTARDLTGLVRRISERKQLLQQHADLTVAA